MTKNQTIFFAKISVIIHSVGTQMSNNRYKNYILILINPVSHKYANIVARVTLRVIMRYIYFQSQTNVCSSVIRCFGDRAFRYQFDRGFARQMALVTSSYSVLQFIGRFLNVFLHHSKLIRYKIILVQSCTLRMIKLNE